MSAATGLFDDVVNLEVGDFAPLGHSTRSQRKPQRLAHDRRAFSRHHRKRARNPVKQNGLITHLCQSDRALTVPGGPAASVGGGAREPNRQITSSSILRRGWLRPCRYGRVDRLRRRPEHAVRDACLQLFGQARESHAAVHRRSRPAAARCASPVTTGRRGKSPGRARRPHRRSDVRDRMRRVRSWSRRRRRAQCRGSVALRTGGRGSGTAGSGTA